MEQTLEEKIHELWGITSTALGDIVTFTGTASNMGSITSIGSWSFGPSKLRPPERSGIKDFLIATGPSPTNFRYFKLQEFIEDQKEKRQEQTADYAALFTRAETVSKTDKNCAIYATCVLVKQKIEKDLALACTSADDYTREFAQEILKSRK